MFNNTLNTDLGLCANCDYFNGVDCDAIHLHTEYFKVCPYYKDTILNPENKKGEDEFEEYFKEYKNSILKIERAVLLKDKGAFTEAGREIDFFFTAGNHYRTCRLAYRKGGRELLRKKIINIIRNYKLKNAALAKREQYLIDSGRKYDI